MLKTLAELDIGWHKTIKKTFKEYELEENLETIGRIRLPIWKSKVRQAIEKKNKIDNCSKKKET